MSAKSAVVTVPKNSKLANYLAWITLSVLFLLPFHAFFTAWAASHIGYFDQIRVWKEIVILFLGFGCMVMLLKGKGLRRQFFGSKITILITLYICLGLLRTAYGYNKEILTVESSAYGIIGAFRYLIFFLAVWLIASRSQILQRLWSFAVIAPATIVVFYGLLQQFVLDKNFLTHFGYGPDTIPAYQSVDLKTDYARAQSTLRGPNPLGAYLALVMTILTGMYYKFKTYRISFGILLAAASILLFATYSRSAWIGLAVSLTVWILLAVKDEKILKYLLMTTIAGVLIVGVGIYSFRDNNFVQNTIFHTDETSQSETSTNSVRTQAIQDGVEDVVHNPLGQGLGSAGPASARGPAPKIAENYYIQVAQEVGIIGLLLYAAITVGVGYQLFQKRTELLPQVLFASLIGISVINVVSHAWMDDVLSLLWWGLAGIALATTISPAIIKGKHYEKQTKSEKFTN